MVVLGLAAGALSAEYAIATGDLHAAKGAGSRCVFVLWRLLVLSATHSGDMNSSQGCVANPSVAFTLGDSFSPEQS